MADPHVLTTLRHKQAEIKNAIAAYEKRAEEARRPGCYEMPLSCCSQLNPERSMSPPTWIFTGYTNVENKPPSAKLLRPQRGRSPRRS